MTDAANAGSATGQDAASATGQDAASATGQDAASATGQEAASAPESPSASGPHAAKPPSAVGRDAGVPRRAEVLGIPLAVSDYTQVLDWMDCTIRCKRRASLTAAAVNLVMSAADDPRTRQAALHATLAVPDGQPLVWALKALGHGEATRVYGPELMARHCERAAKDATPVFLYGGRDEKRLKILEERLSQRFPGLVIAGGFSPPFRALTSSEREHVIEIIERSGAQVVWVGTGQPKQELWMAEMRPRLSAPLLVGVGAAFDFHAGLLAQAPRWMQSAGLEWAYRLYKEPRRLWRRYATQNPRFVAGFLRQYARERRSRRTILAGGEMYASTRRRGDPPR